MATIQGRGGKFAGFALALLVASFGVSSCGGEEGDTPDPVQPGQGEPGVQTPTLNPAACAAAARGGKVDVCHTEDEDLIPESAITVPTESCSSIHARHPGDFLADASTGCLQFAKKCTPAGRSCKIGKTACCGTSVCICLGGKKCTCS